jgi:RNA polymerase sigma-70 factor (ECF subfamily)
MEPAEVVETHGPWLMAWFRVRGASLDEAEELTQEVLVRLLRNLEHIRAERAVTAWLRRAAADLLARHRRRVRPERLSEEPCDPATPIDGRLEELRMAVAELPTELEEVLLVRYARGLNYEEVAAALGLPRATVQSRLRRAIALLKRRLSAGSSSEGRRIEQEDSA